MNITNTLLFGDNLFDTFKIPLILYNTIDYVYKNRITISATFVAYIVGNLIRFSFYF